MNTISNTEFLRLKQLAKENEPIQKVTLLKDIGLDGLAESIPHIKIEGTDVRVSEDFLESFCSKININVKLLTMFQRKEKKRVTGANGKKKMTTILTEDKASKLALIDAIKDYRTKMKGDHQMLLIGDPLTKRIVDVCDAKYYNRITNSALFEVVEYIANTNLFGLSVNHVKRFDDGNFHIGLLANNPIKIEGFNSDETFAFGTTLVSSFTKTSLMDYNMRLICSNGMMDVASREMAELGGNKILTISQFNDKSIHKLIGAIDEQRQANYIPAGFAYNLKKCDTTQASLREVEQAFEICSSHIKENDDKLKEAFEFSLKENHFPAIRSTYERIKDKVNVAGLSEEQKSYIKTPMTMWDTINAVTYLASNDSGITFDNPTAMKKEAGKLMKGSIDLEHISLATV